MMIEASKINLKSISLSHIRNDQTKIPNPLLSGTPLSVCVCFPEAINATNIFSLLSRPPCITFG